MGMKNVRQGVRRAKLCHKDERKVFKEKRSGRPVSVSMRTIKDKTDSRNYTKINCSTIRYYSRSERVIRENNLRQMITMTINECYEKSKKNNYQELLNQYRRRLFSHEHHLLGRIFGSALLPQKQTAVNAISSS